MTTLNADTDRRFYRDADRAVLGGVCAGLAGYLGFNLKMTRFLAFIAFLMAMPIAVIGYLAAVFLIPSVSGKKFGAAADLHHQQRPWRNRHGRRDRRKARKEQESTDAPKSSVAADINHRCQSMDERLARLEKHVTSKRFQIEQELERL
jgi:phage shock protein C